MAKKRKPSRLGLSAVDHNATVILSSNFNHLPREIVAEIMSRLPPESLMEGKCLSKSWYFVIKGLEFVTKHLHHAKASPATLLVYHGLWLGNPTEGRLASIDHLSSELMTQLLTTTPSCDNTGEKDGVNWAAEDLDLPHYLFGHGHVSVYHCNGIICLIKDSKTVTLCSPALRKFSTFHPETDLVIKHYRILGTGFGSDSRDGDYKIVSLLKPMKAEVFTPGTTTNSWREIGISIEDEQYGTLDSHAYFDGNCFWLMFGAPMTVLCFNLRSEVFHTMPLPDELDTFDESCSSLTVGNDSVCLFRVRKFLSHVGNECQQG